MSEPSPQSEVTAETETARPPAVQLRDVSKIYRMGGQAVHALDGVSLSIQRGAYTAVMGPSGSGKSTLMNVVGCLDTPTEGVVEVDGVDVTLLSDTERTALRGDEIGFVFQTFNLMPQQTAQENVELPMTFQGINQAERQDRATELLTRVGLGDRLDHKPSELSGGQRQRVAIARALANDPAIILADEPTGNLDSETEAEILELFEELNAAGNTILVVSHERIVAEHAERIIHLFDGEVETIEEIDDRRIAGEPGR
jgi:putative ABC transport system ATP-binding protein